MWTGGVRVIVLDEEGRMLLVKQHHEGKDIWMVPGGGIEEGEGARQAAAREVKEETGLDIQDLRLCGTKQFQTGSGARYVVFFYRASKYHGTLQSSSEGRVFWLPRCELQNQQLAPDMMEMVRVMESDSLSEFYYQKVDGNWQYTLY